MIDPHAHVSRLACSWHAQRRALGNFSFRRHRRFDAFIVTMHQSGTHWLKYLLTLMIARERGLPPPQSISDNIAIGGPRETPRHDLRPRLGQSHTIPSPLLDLALGVPGAGFPDYLVLVRDVRDVLLAHYRKWQTRYDCSFSEYLRGDVTRRRFEKDVWWDFRFLNAWGAIAAHHPRRVQVLRYEDLLRDPAAELRAVVAFLRIPLADVDAAIAYALAGASKDAMAARDSRPYGMAVVNDEVRDWDTWYAPADRAWLREACRRHLHHDFGYGYADWH